MDVRRWLGPGSGVVFVVLMVVGFGIGGSQPTSDASAARVTSFYTAHHGQAQAAAYLISLALLVGLLFYGYLRDVLADSGGGLAVTGFGGAVVFGVGAAISAGTQFALATSPARLEPDAAQALNLVNNYMQAPAVDIGAALVLIAFGAAIVQRGGLPSWLGWLGVVLGVISAVQLHAVGPIPAAVWTLIVSIVLGVRGTASTAKASG